jgi:hypothetical protein
MHRSTFKVLNLTDTSKPLLSPSNSIDGIRNHGIEKKEENIIGCFCAIPVKRWQLLKYLPSGKNLKSV